MICCCVLAFWSSRGGESYIYGKLINETPITIHSPGQTNVKQSEQITIGAKRDSVYLFDNETGISLLSEES